MNDTTVSMSGWVFMLTIVLPWVVAAFAFASAAYLKGKLDECDCSGWIEEVDYWRTTFTKLLGGEISLEALGEQIAKSKEMLPDEGKSAEVEP